MRWNIYILDREYASNCGDPLLGIVQADSKEEAEEEAREAGITNVGGIFAVKDGNFGWENE